MWYEWIDFDQFYRHAKFYIYRIYSVGKNRNIKVFATDTPPAALTLIITQTPIFHACQKPLEVLWCFSGSRKSPESLSFLRMETVRLNESSKDIIIVQRFKHLAEESAREKSTPDRRYEIENTETVPLSTAKRKKERKKTKNEN